MDIGALDGLASSPAFSPVLVGGLLAFAAAFRAGAAFAVIDQPRLPPTSGECETVGVHYARCGGARVKVFYPAAAPSSQPAPYCTDGRATSGRAGGTPPVPPSRPRSDGMAGLVGFRQLGPDGVLPRQWPDIEEITLGAPRAGGPGRLETDAHAEIIGCHTTALKIVDEVHHYYPPNVTLWDTSTRGLYRQ